MGRRLKVLHTMTWLSEGGGVDREVYLTVESLLADYDVHLAVGSEIHRNPFAGIQDLRLIVCPDLVRPISLIRDLKAVLFFYRLIRRERYDVVHTHETKASLITRIAARLAGCPLIIYGLAGVTFNDPMNRLKRAFYIWLERLTIRAAHLVVAVSRSVVEHYRANGIGEGIPFAVVYSGIDIERFDREAAAGRKRRDELRRSLGIGTDDIVLINVGRFSYSKAQRYTLWAFARLRAAQMGLKLLLVGDGELKGECKELAKELGVASDTVFYGFTDDVAQAFALGDIQLLTSLREGLPRVAVESYLCGVPLVSFEVEGVREIVEDGATGFVVPPHDVDALVERTSRLVRDPALRRSFAERGRERARRLWSHLDMISAYKEIYEGGRDGRR